MRTHVPTNYHFRSMKKSKLIMTKYLNKTIRAIKANSTPQEILDNLYQAKEYAPQKYWWRVVKLYGHFLNKYYPLRG